MIAAPRGECAAGEGGTAADSQTFALGMAAAAWLVGIAIEWNHGYYNPWALALVTAAIAIGGAVCVWSSASAVEALTPRGVTGIVAVAILIEALLLWIDVGATGVAGVGIACVGLIGVLQAAHLGALRLPLIGLALGVFWIAASTAFQQAPTPHIDVLVFQQMGAAGLLHGQNPYTPMYPNMYEADTPFYGPGVVDASNHLTIGLPYPPLSLLLVLPGYLLGGDCRFADVAAIAASAGLIFLARPSRWTGLMAALFLLTPRVLFVIEYAWTETLFAFSFSLLMFCALRWRRGLPYALGAFLATKQYSVVALPFVPLLLGANTTRRNALRLIGPAVVVAGAITLPFVLWDPHAFWRSVVEFQFVQPLRTESLSHLVWIHKYFPQLPWQQAIPFLALAVTMGIARWRSRPTPACFAGSFAIVQLVFFACSKQAFANYYFFVIATLCWAAAAASWNHDEARV